MTDYYEKWTEMECACTACSWRGTAGACGRSGLHRGVYLELCCPECSSFVDLLILPEEKCCAAADEGLTEEQLQAKKEAAEQERLYREQCLKSADQLPELAGGDVTLLWDQVEGETQIRSGETVLWREPVAFEGFERYERIARLLLEKYGARVLDLVPTERSLLFLFGDYAPSLDYLRKVRKELFGVDVSY
jgi:hypothetical protein